MTTAHRFVSLSVLGASALALAPLASAQGFGGARHDSETRTEIRAELEACREDNAGDREAMKACADAVLEQYGIERPERPDRPELPEEAREELEACREENEGDHEAMKECADAVFAEYGIERPEHPGRRGRKMGHKFRTSIEETCGERENTDDWKQCARETRSSAREDVREHRANLREQLKACLELSDIDELKACVQDIRDAIREQSEE